MVAGGTLLFWDLSYDFAIYTGAIIYKDPSKVLVITVAFSPPDIFKILMIALGTFMLIHFEEDQHFECCHLFYLSLVACWAFFQRPSG